MPKIRVAKSKEQCLHCHFKTQWNGLNHPPTVYCGLECEGHREGQATLMGGFVS